MAQTIKEVLANPLITVIEQNDAGQIYRFRLGILQPIICIRLHKRANQHFIDYETSHVIKTPWQIGPYRPCMPFADTPKGALAKAIGNFTWCYKVAVKDGHSPNDDWLLAICALPASPAQVDAMPVDPRYVTAIHEAGHAVISRVLGLPCGEVTIESDDDQELGYAAVDDPGRDWQRGDGPRRPLIEASCVGLYAGAEAERIIVGNTVAGDGPDCSKATSLISIVGVRGAVFVGDDVWERYEARLRSRSVALVKKHRWQIERVAHALTEQGTLTDEQVNELIA